MNMLVKIEHNDNQHNSYTLVDWFLGNTCNYRCSYCPDKLHNGTNKWLDISTAISFCRKLISHYTQLGQKLYFQFTGGEPTLYKNIFELMGYLKGFDCKIGIISNGSRSVFWQEKVLHLLDTVVLTHHIEFVNIDEFTKLVQLISERVRTHINITMLPTEFEQCLFNARVLVNKCQNITITLKPLLIEFGTKLYPYTDQQLLIFKNTILKVSNTNSHISYRGMMRKVFDDGNFVVCKASDFIINDENHWKGWLCNAGLELLSIDLDGNIYRGACKVGGKIGNISDSDILLPKSPIVCNRQTCHCLADIMTTRIKN